MEWGVWAGLIRVFPRSSRLQCARARCWSFEERRHGNAGRKRALPKATFLGHSLKQGLIRETRRWESGATWTHTITPWEHSCGFNLLEGFYIIYDSSLLWVDLFLSVGFCPSAGRQRLCLFFNSVWSSPADRI